jgi:putative ABC transport system permease protein
MRVANWIYSLPLHLRSLLLGRRADVEVDEELRDHLDRQTAENLARGMNAFEARRAALVAMGGVEQQKQQCREARGVSWLGDMGRDIQYGLRTMLRRPTFTLSALMILALGIGANTAIMSADRAVLFHRLPYSEPDRLVEIFQKSLTDASVDTMPVAPANYFDWRNQKQTFESSAAWRVGSFNLSGGDHPERVRSAQVSVNLFSVLGVQPMLGREFRSGEDLPGAASAAILSYPLWQRRFAGDPNVVGKAIRANDQVYIVAGVMPPEFRFPIGWLANDVEVWTPLVLSDAERSSRKDITLGVVARLHPGVTVAQAEAGLAAVATNLAQTYPETNKDWGVHVIPLAERGVSAFRQLFLLLSVAVALVLLIACANVANLLLARGLERQKELTVRTALGARRGRLVRQLVTEGVLLSLGGGFPGLGLGYAGTRVLVALTPSSEMPELKHAAVDPVVLAASLGLSLLTGFVFSVLPALMLSGVSLHGTLQEGGRANTGTVRSHRLKTALVAGEVALTLALLLCAGDILNSFVSYMSLDPGFDQHNVLTMRMALPQKKYNQAQQWSAFFDRAIQEVRTIPGVTDAAVGSGAPMEEQGVVMRFHTTGGRVSQSFGEGSAVEYDRITPNYFRVSGMRVVRGRGVLASDRQGQPPVAVVNETFAKKQFGTSDPIGKVVFLDGDVNGSAAAKTTGPPLEIVGVIRDTKEYGLFQITPGMIFVPMAQDPEQTVSLLVKTAGPPGSVLPAIRERLARVDPEEPVYNVRTLADLVNDQHALFRFNTFLLAAFAAMALVLSAIGIYGVVAYAVGQRSREFGIRLALGSSRRNILALVLRQAAWMSGIGIAAGLLLGWPSTRVLAETLQTSMFLTLRATGPLLYGAMSGGMALTMVLACFVPAYRATQADPVETLRGG